MPDTGSSEVQRLEELRETGRVIGKLAEDEATFTRTAEAFPAQIKEMREFAQATARLTADDALLKAFLIAVDNVDEKAFNELLVRTKWQRFCHQICHFLC